MAAVGREAGGAELFDQKHRQLACRPARCHRSSPEGGGIFFRRGAAEAVPDDLQQLTVILQYVQRNRRTQNAITFPRESVLPRS